MFELIKLFDCQQMPEIVRTQFFMAYRALNMQPGNNSIVKWDYWTKEGFRKQVSSSFRNQDISFVNMWLREHGASEKDGMVFIRHWW